MRTERSCGGDPDCGDGQLCDSTGECEPGSRAGEDCSATFSCEAYNNCDHQTGRCTTVASSVCSGDDDFSFFTVKLPAFTQALCRR